MREYQTYKRNVNNTPKEYWECLALVDYLEIKKLKYSHIHHEMYTRSYAQKNKAKRLGVKPGVPDYIICLEDKLLFIEMKRVKRGSVSEYQKEWIEKLSKITNVEAHVCYGFDEAKEVIDRNLV